jgi:hypothetical protein
MTYRTLVRNVSFIRPRRKGQSEFSLQELLALKAFALLRAHGLKSRIAAAAVEIAYHSISTYAIEGKLQSDCDYKLGARLMSARGRLIAAPIHGVAPPGAEEVGRVELDVRGVAALLPGQRRTGDESQPLFGLFPVDPG